MRVNLCQSVKYLKLLTEPLTLTCAVNFTDHYKKDYGVVHAIAVTIKEKPSEYGGVRDLACVIENFSTL